MSVLTGVLAITSAIAILALLPVGLAVYWVRVFRKPSGERGWAVYRAISSTIAFIVFIAVVAVLGPGGLPFAVRVYYAAGFHMPLVLQLLFIALFLGSLVELYRESRLIAEARAKLAAREAKEARGHNWPYGSDNPQ